MLSISYVHCAHSLVNNGKKPKEHEVSTWKPELSKRASFKKSKAVEEEWEPELSKRCSKKKKNN